jgi:hypothetical protein
MLLNLKSYLLRSIVYLTSVSYLDDVFLIAVPFGVLYIYQNKGSVQFRSLRTIAVNGLTLL